MAVTLHITTYRLCIEAGEAVRAGGPAAACPAWLASLYRAVQRRRRALWLGKRSRSDSSVAEAGLRQGARSEDADENRLRGHGAEVGLVPLHAEQPLQGGTAPLREGASS